MKNSESPRRNKRSELFVQSARSRYQGAVHQSNVFTRRSINYIYIRWWPGRIYKYTCDDCEKHPLPHRRQLRRKSFLYKKRWEQCRSMRTAVVALKSMGSATTAPAREEKEFRARSIHQNQRADALRCFSLRAFCACYNVRSAQRRWPAKNLDARTFFFRHVFFLKRSKYTSSFFFSPCRNSLWCLIMHVLAFRSCSSHISSVLVRILCVLGMRNSSYFFFFFSAYSEYIWTDISTRALVISDYRQWD